MRYAKKITVLTVMAAVVVAVAPPTAASVSGASFLRPALEPSTVVTTAVVHPAFGRAARDMVGYEPSLYTGKWYQKSAEPIRKCIMHRESRFHYTTRNGSSSAAGAYQFLDNDWRWSLTYMMIDEERALPGKPSKKIIKEIRSLRSMNIAQWNRYWQDRAFWTAWRYGAGAKHWYHPSIRCF